MCFNFFCGETNSSWWCSLLIEYLVVFVKLNGRTDVLVGSIGGTRVLDNIIGVHWGQLNDFIT